MSKSGIEMKTKMCRAAEVDKVTGEMLKLGCDLLR